MTDVYCEGGTNSTAVTSWRSLIGIKAGSFAVRLVQLDVGSRDNQQAQGFQVYVYDVTYPSVAPGSWDTSVSPANCRPEDPANSIVIYGKVTVEPVTNLPGRLWLPGSLAGKGLQYTPPQTLSQAQVTIPAGGMVVVRMDSNVVITEATVTTRVLLCEEQYP